jgi:methyl-accepting chemotaxis protein
MVQDAISRGDALASETEKLDALIKQFRIAATGSARTMAPDSPDRLEAAITKTNSASQPAQARPKRAATGSAQQDSVWEHF